MFDRCLLICSYFLVLLNVICVTADNENATIDEFKYIKYFKNASATNTTTSLPETTREVISQVRFISKFSIFNLSGPLFHRLKRLHLSVFSFQQFFKIEIER